MLAIRIPTLSLLPVAVVLCLSSMTAQTSSTLVRGNPAQQYESVRATMEEFYQHGLLHSNIDREGTTYDLNSCPDPGNYMGSTDAETPAGGALAKLLLLAETTVTWRHDLSKLGVPEEVSQPLISNFENESLAEGGELPTEQKTAAAEQIVAALNRYRQQSNPRLPGFIYEGGCGAGEISVQIALQPPDGQIFIIPVFLYKLCAAQHLNPQDPRSCDRWTEVINGTAAYVSGDYIYLARWADGVVRCGPLGFNSFDQDGKTLRITKLRSPECNPGW